MDARILRILAASLDAVDPAILVHRALEGAGGLRHRRIFLLGLGKAAESMTAAAAAVIPDFSEALVITKHLKRPRATAELKDRSPLQLPESAPRVTYMEAGHPIPDARSVAAAQAALILAHSVGDDDMLICLISGGGSALATSPAAGISLHQIQKLTADLLACGANIDEINVLRRQLDVLKGGGLAEAAKGRVLSLVLSDVPGDHLEAIASGPTVLDSTTRSDALGILSKYRIEVPENVLRFLESPTEVKNRSLASRVENRIIGSNALAKLAAADAAEQDGLHAQVLESPLKGEARQAGPDLATRLRAATLNSARPMCIIGGGETTVRVTGSGRGGRNQELALSAVDGMDGLKDCFLVALATDGEDGPTDAAGAVVAGQTRDQAVALGMHAQDFLTRNDAYTYFDALGDLIRTGPTGTNVNDLVLLFRL